MHQGFNGLPPFGELPSDQMFGTPDVVRNGANTGGTAASLEDPGTPVQQMATDRLQPTAVLNSTTGVVLIAAAAFLYLNGQPKRKKK